MPARRYDQSVEGVQPPELRVDEATPAWAEALQHDQKIWQSILAEYHLLPEQFFQLFPAAQGADFTILEFRDKLGQKAITLTEAQKQGLRATLDAAYTMVIPASKSNAEDQAARAYWQKLLDQHVDITLVTAALNALLNKVGADSAAIASEWDFTPQLFATPADYQTWLKSFELYEDRVNSLARRLGLGSPDVPLTTTERKLIALCLRLGVRNQRAFAAVETPQKVE